MAVDVRNGSSGKEEQKKEKKEKEEGKSSKLDQVVEAQKETVARFSDFAGDVAKLSMGGNFKPEAWVAAWKKLASGLAEVTKTLLKD